ncbi:MAG: OFA family oxalate/formate antiporter-like MFS transporter [Limisphaerales bacterium]|jgi:OFA family oxalate/formate antiporter-like MFS transporter
MRQPVKQPTSSEIRSQWRLLTSAGAGIIFSVLVLPYYTIGVMVVPITEEFGWSRASFLAATFFSAGLGAVTSPLIGWLCDRYGSRRVALPSIAGLSGGFLLAASIDGEIWLLYLAYASMAVLGAGTIPVTWTKAITDSFDKQRGLALGLALSGTGICGILMPQFATYLVEDFGWRTAYVGLAVLPLLIGLPVVFWGFRPIEAGTRDDQVTPSYLDYGLTLRQASRRSTFWVLLISIFLVYMAASGIGANLYPAITDAGMSTSDAATVLSFFGGAVIAGRLLVGYLVDKFWAPGVAAGTMVLPLIGCLMLIEPEGFYSSVIAAVLIGMAAGAELDLMSFLASRYFGQKHYALIYSVLYMALAICSGGAPLVFASIYDQTSSYAISFSIAAGLFGAGGLVVLLMGRYPCVPSIESGQPKVDDLPYHRKNPDPI